MEKQTMGKMISSLRKMNGMTQLELADKMNVTDKAVSKWERDLSCPDVNSMPKLAELFNISVDELLQAEKKNARTSKVDEIVEMVLKGLSVAMGVAVIVTSILNQIDTNSAFTMLGIGLTCAGISLLKDKAN